MILYFLVGFEILRQGRFIKSLDSDHVTQHSGNNLSLNHYHGSVSKTIDTNVQYPPHTYHLHNGKEFALETSAPASTSSHQRADSATFDHQSAKRPTISFRQYILMPLMFFFLLLAIWVAPTVNRVASFINPSFVSFPLYLAVGSMGSLRGFWNGVVFIVIGMKERKRRERTRIF